jgi:GMP synthase (glutamine-hydrolysing)
MCTQVKLLQRANANYLKEICVAGLYECISQAFAVLLPIHAVGVMSDRCMYEQVIVLHMVQSEDSMTANWFIFLPNVLRHVSFCIMNGIAGINRVTYNIMSKLPSICSQSLEV